MRNIYNLPIFFSCMNDTLRIKEKVSYYDLKTIFFHFPPNYTFKADPDIFFQYFSTSPEYLKKGINYLVTHEEVLLRQNLSDVYRVNQYWKENFKPKKEELGLILEDISHEIWRELKRKRKTFKIED